MNDLPGILTTGDAARVLGKSPMTVVRACTDGKLKFFRTPGGHRRIRTSDLRDFIAARIEDPDDHFSR